MGMKFQQGLLTYEVNAMLSLSIDFGKVLLRNMFPYRAVRTASLDSSLTFSGREQQVQILLQIKRIDGYGMISGLSVTTIIDY